MTSIVTRIMTYTIRIAASISQMGNAVLLGGWPDETISGRMHREKRRIPKGIINTIFFVQEDHCRSSHLADIEFCQMILKDKNSETEEG